MKTTILGLVAIALCAATLPQAHASFTDVPASHENYVSIMHLKDTEVINGYSDGSFKPDQLVNRAEALKIILEGAKKKVEEDSEFNDFSDIKPTDWFAKYVKFAKGLEIVNGNPDGTFAPARTVKRAEFMKMLLLTNKFRADQWKTSASFEDIPKDAWFHSYMSYAGSAGIITADAGKLYPEKDLSRAEVAEMLYLMKIILNGNNVTFLNDQAQKHLTQVEAYILAKDVRSAQRSAEISIDLTQQAYSIAPENTTVLAVAKLARAYESLVNTFIAALESDRTKAEAHAEIAKQKATEAWEVNNEVQGIAKHIKDTADSILAQIQ